jgi:hypothetical protein
VLAPARGEPLPDPPETPARRSPYARVLVGAVVAILVWQLVPGVPHDQTLILSLGSRAVHVARLDVSWEASAGGHEGGFTLNFPSQPPERVSRRLRLADGPYVFRVSAERKDAGERRTEVTRQVTLDGSTVTLRIEELAE